MPPMTLTETITRLPAVASLMVHDALTNAPELHEQGLEAERVGVETQPQQVAVHPVKLGPDHPQVLRAGRDFHAHHLLDALAVAGRMDHRADTTDTLDDLDHLNVVTDIGQGFKTAVDIAEGRNGLGDDFVLHRKRQVDRLRENRMLRSKRYDRSCHDLSFKRP